MEGWNTIFLLGRPIFRGELLVSGRVYCNSISVHAWIIHQSEDWQDIDKKTHPLSSLAKGQWGQGLAKKVHRWVMVAKFWKHRMSHGNWIAGATTKGSILESWWHNHNMLCMHILKKYWNHNLLHASSIQAWGGDFCRRFDCSNWSKPQTPMKPKVLLPYCPPAAELFPVKGVGRWWRSFPWLA